MAVVALTNMLPLYKCVKRLKR